MPKQKLLLLGASGFIGRNLSEAFQENYHLLTPTHADLDLLDDKNIQHYLKKHTPDIIIHAAVKGSTRKTKDNPSLLEENLQMFRNLLKARNRQKIIFLGSGAEYDKSQDIKQVKEESFGVSVPKDNYGKYKFECSRLIEKEEEIINLRLFGVYGKYEDYETRFISNAICRSLLNLPITIENQNVFFSYLYIDDLTRIIEYFIKNKGKHKFYNAGGTRVDLLTLAEEVRKISGKNIKVMVKHQGLGREYTADSSRLLKEMKPFAFTPYKKAIRELYQWYQQHLSEIDKGSFQ